MQMAGGGLTAAKDMARTKRQPAGVWRAVQASGCNFSARNLGAEAVGRLAAVARNLMSILQREHEMASSSGKNNGESISSHGKPIS